MLSMFEQSLSSEALAFRFNRLVQDLLLGKLKRNCFQRWEVDILLDIESCEMGAGAKRQALKRYQRAVTRQLSKGEVIIVPSNTPHWFKEVNGEFLYYTIKVR